MTDASVVAVGTPQSFRQQLARALEIEADDVRCTHGATVSPVEEEHLFYLMSRGIDRVTATRLSFFMAIPALTAAQNSGRLQPRRSDSLSLIATRQASKTSPIPPAPSG